MVATNIYTIEVLFCVMSALVRKLDGLGRKFTRRWHHETHFTVHKMYPQFLLLRHEVGVFHSEMTLLNDIQVMRTLHFKYEAYWDNILYDQIIDLVTDM